MKLIKIFTIVFLCNCVYTNAQSQNGKDKKLTDSSIKRVKELKEAYSLSKLSSNDLSNIYKQKFFDAFPNTFKQFYEIYEYNGKTPGPLSDVAFEHVSDLFNNLDNINDSLYYKKIISIAIEGHWDSDAVNFFQHGLKDRVLINPELTVYILKSMNDAQIHSFWYFYFDSPHPQKQIPEQLQRIKSMNNRIYDLMVKAQSEVLKYWKQ